jgi:hypothetical protein
MSYKEPSNRKAGDVDVSTVILTAAMYFGGNKETTIRFVRSTGLMPCMLNKSRFNRRIHRIGELPVELVFHTDETVKSLNLNYTYCIDSFPTAVCHNIRISDCRIVKSREMPLNLSPWK